MTEPTSTSRFPPPLVVGARVWTIQGYHDHGPMDGPKVNVTGDQGGTVQGTTKPYLTMDQLLYTVQWDNGQTSKHYANGLFCIGRFAALDEFRAAIIPQGPVELTLGPQGGFREATVSLTYDGATQISHLYQGDRALWDGFIESMVKERALVINEVRLPSARRRQAVAQQGTERDGTKRAAR